MSLPTIVFQDQRLDPQWLEAEVARICAGFQAADIQHGSAIAIMMRNGPAYVALILACRRAGIYYVSINWHSKGPEAQYMLDDSSAKMLFIHDDLLAQVSDGIPAEVAVVIVPTSPVSVSPQLERDVVLWDAFGQGAPTMEPRPRLHFGSVQYTSGTTGRPKGVRRVTQSDSQRVELEQSSRKIGRIASGMKEGVTVLISAPIYHSGVTQYLMQACDAQATIVLESSFDALRTLELIERHSITHAYLVPTMYRRLLSLSDTDRQRFNISSIQHVASTGAPCPADVKRRMMEWFGPVITEAYGASETGFVTFIDGPTWLQNPGSVGQALGPAILRVLDANNQDAPIGTVGTVYVRQPALPDFTYVNRPESRAAIEVDGLVSLGDMGYLDERGFLYICDRATDMIISGGANIYPAEVEAVLQGMPGVADCAVFGVPDAEFGESVAAAVQPQAGAQMSAEEVQTYLRQQMANFKVPRLIEFHDQLPREDTGKIFKRRLRDPHWEGHNRRI